MPPTPDPSAPFGELFGHLIQVLRGAPERQELIQEAVARLVARVVVGPALLEAGIENSWAVDGDPLKERLQIRQVDAIHVAQGAGAAELLALARALADDHAPIPNTAQVRVKLLPDPMPLRLSGQQVAASGADHPTVPRARPGDQLAGLVEGILKELDKAIHREQWHTVLHNAQAALRLLPGMPEETRRLFAIALKRQLSRPVMEKLIEQAYRIPEEQARTAEVLRAGGLPVAEQLLEILRQSGAVGPRAFLLEAVGGMPEAFAMIAPLARSTRPAEAWIGTELLGRIAVPEGLPLLAQRTADPDERIRHAAIDGLGRLRDKGAVEPLRQALSHPSAATRVRATRALAARGTAGIAMPLFAAFETEKDPEAWQQMLETLVALDAAEIGAALARLALERRGFLSFGSTDLKRQLAIVGALAARNSPAARQALARIAAEGQGEVRAAAQAAVTNPMGS
ncbi:MAG: HEAT repeat domain-containing protein [Gemmatimonadota bacterium]|nr:HEAT repeat domain-containing protein [Gemmatimonadota bacterium]